MTRHPATIRSDAIDTLLVNEAEFQADLARFSREFTAYERRRINQFSTKQLTGYDFLVQYFSTIQPTITTIQAASENTKFRRETTNQLCLPEDEARGYISRLAAQRSREVLREAVIRYYNIPPKQHASSFVTNTVETLLTQHDSIETYLQHAQNFYSYATLAHECGVPYLDHQASFLRRQQMKRRVKHHAERMDSARYRDYYHAKRKQLIEVVYAGVLHEVIEFDWNLATVLALRNKYEKSLKTAKTSDDPYQNLLVLEQTTKEFVAEETQRLNPAASMSEHQATKATIQALLVRIFSLSPVQKNNFLLLLKEYKRLT